MLSRIPGGCLLLCITQQLVSTIGNGIGINQVIYSVLPAASCGSTNFRC